MRTTFFRSAFLLLASAFVWAASAQPGWTQQNDFTDTPGYVDFNEVGQWFDVPANIEVNLRGSLLDLIANSSNDSDFARLVGDLQVIQARGYPMSSDTQDEVMRQFDELSNRLESDGWERVVFLRDEGESVNIYVKSDGESIAGLTVMLADPNDGETMFVNIVGSIRPDELGKIGRGLDIEPLQNMDDTSTQRN